MPGTDRGAGFLGAPGGDARGRWQVAGRAGPSGLQSALNFYLSHQEDDYTCKPDLQGAREVS